VTDTTTQQHKIVIIGGGYSGIGMAIKLKQAGIEDFVILEKAHKLGGTWRENTYPKAGADTPSIIYSFSFARNPDWDHTFALQPQIEKYLDDVAERFGVVPHVHFNTHAELGTWDEDAKQWTVNTNNGSYTAKYVVACSGPMHEATLPQIPGIESFAGDHFHSAKWDHDVELKDRRVTVIGTGASAIQFVPEIQPLASQFTIFQRTPPWVLPRSNRRARTWKKQMYKRFPWINQRVADMIYGGSEALQHAQRHPKIMKQIQRAGIWNINRQVSDPVLREQFKPNFVLGCKRMLFSNTWYPALTAPNSKVVPLGVREITPEGPVDTEGNLHPSDVIIYGTGFRVTDPDIAHRVRGRDGVLLSDLWQGSPQAYLSTTVHGYPNAFVLLGPNVGNGHGSVSTLIELLSDYITGAIATAEQNGLASIEVKERVQEIYNLEVQDSLEGTVFNAGGCASYYLDVNGRNSSIYPWTTIHFRKQTQRFNLDDYETTLPSPAPGEVEKEAVTA
jgi:cation diffusion facilitator CzcD-associated flavoprotein CzcO